MRIMILLFLGIWLGSTCLVDFLVMPAVFGNIADTRLAGKVGMFLFGRYNWVELVLGALVSGFSFKLFLDKKAIWPLVLAIFITILAATYSFYLTPKITQLSQFIHAGSVESPEVLSAIKDHQFFHKLYVKLDGGKILIIIGLIIGHLVASKKELRQ